MGNRLAGRRTAAPDGHLEGVDHELRTHVIGDRPTDDGAAEGVEDHGQIRLAVLGRVLGDVHDPEAVRLGGVEGPLDQIVGRFGAIALGAASAAASVDAGDARLAHQALDPFARAAHVLAELELGVDPWRAIGAPAHGPDVDDGVGQIGVVEVLLAHRVGLPAIEARRRHPHHPTAGRDGQVGEGPGDEGVGHFGPGSVSLAK
jgi:hypothetical protein